MKDYMIDVVAMIADEVCSHCAIQKKLWQCRRTTCPYQSYFDELTAKCVDIEKDANYLLDLAADEEDPEDLDYDTYYQPYDPFKDFELFHERIMSYESATCEQDRLSVC